MEKVHPLCVAKAFTIGKMMDMWTPRELREKLWELMNEGCVPDPEARRDLQYAAQLLWESQFEPTTLERDAKIARAKLAIVRAFNRLSLLRLRG